MIRVCSVEILQLRTVARLRHIRHDHGQIATVSSTLPVHAFCSLFLLESLFDDDSLNKSVKHIINALFVM